MSRPTKFFTFVALFFVFFSQLSNSVHAASLSDITGNKNQTAIEWLYDNGIISGYPDGTFRPRNGINRAELLKTLVAAKKVNLSAAQYKNCFPDVKEEWFAPFVCYAKEQGWVQGYPDNTFRPEKNIIKAEAIKMLINSRGYEVPQIFTETPKLFDDVQSGTWYYRYLYVAKEKGLLEQTGGVYGIAAFMTRGEISENLYRAMFIEQNGLNKFPVKETPMTSQASCTSAIQEFGNVAVQKDQMKILSVAVCNGYRYTACTQNPLGNPDLYGGTVSPTIGQFEQKSTDDVKITTDGNGNQSSAPRPDCITFEPKGTQYYLGVFGAAVDSKTNIWISGSKMAHVPQGFERSLVWFADSCVELTNLKYGPFNTPWGNDVDLDRPFFDGYPNYLHGGSDYACPANTVVKAMCDGVIADSGDAGGDWGWHTVLECKSGNNAVSIALIHIQTDSALPIGTLVKAGDTIGKVFALNVPGEVEHIHMTGCQKSHGECEAAGFHPERGAARRTEWWGAHEFWFDMDWKTNPNLYKISPAKQQF
jgi:hypothetical protein